MATKTGDVKVNISADIRELRKQLRAAERHTQTWQKRMQKIGMGMRNIGRQMTMGFTVPIVAGLALATKAAIEDQKSQEMLAVQVSKVTKATEADIEVMEEWIDQRARATGVADDELRPALSRLVAATGDLAEAENLLAVSQDVATSTGKSLDTVILAMVKGVNGVTGGFGRMGIATKNAKGEALTFDEILAELEKKFGGSTARAADTAAGKMARLRVAFQETAEEIGAILLPFVEKLADWTGKLAAKFDDLSPTTKKVIVVIGLLLAVLGPLLMILGQIIIIAPAVGAAFTFMLGPVGLIIVAIGALIAVFVLLYVKNKTFRDWVNRYWPVIADFIVFAARAIARALRGIISAVSAVIGAFRRLISFVTGSGIGSAIARTLLPGIGAIQSMITLIYRALGLFDQLALKSSAAGRGGGFSVGGRGRGGGGGTDANGGVYTSPRFTLVGEAGPEAIIPLSRPRRAAQVMEQAGLGGVTVNVNLPVGSVVVGTVEELERNLRPHIYKGLQLAMAQNGRWRG